MDWYTILPPTPPKKGRPSQEDILKDFRREFVLDFRAHRDWLKEIEDDEKFYDGEQWTKEEKLELEKRNQPVVTVNLIKPKIDSIVGMELGIPVDTKAFPRGNADFETAKHITEALRYSEQKMDFDSLESDAFKGSIVGGVYWYEMTERWDGLDLETGARVLDAHTVIRDRDSVEVDLSDCIRISKHYLTTTERLKDLFPNKKKEINDVLTSQISLGDRSFSEHMQVRPDQYDAPNANDVSPNDQHLFINKQEKKIRVVQTQYRKAIVERFVSHPELGTVDVTNYTQSELSQMRQTFDDGQIEEWVQERFTLNTITFIWNAVLEHKKDIRKFDQQAKYKYIMVPAWSYAQRKRKGQFYGLVRQMRDMQKEVNKRRSKMLHLLNTNMVIADEGAVEDRDQARTEAAKPDGFVTKRQGFDFQINRNTEPAQSQALLLQESKAEINNTGVSANVQDFKEASSGRDFKLRQEFAMQQLRPIIKNLREARLRVFKYTLDNIQQFWTSERLVKVSDDPDAQAVVLNQRVTDPLTGQEVVLNDVSLGKYDLIIEEAPETLNLEQESFSLLADLAIKGYPVPMEMLIELSPFPQKQKWLQKFREQQQQQQALLQAQLEAQGGGGGQLLQLPQQG